MLWTLKVMQLGLAWEGTQALNSISMSGGKSARGVKEQILR